MDCVKISAVIITLNEERNIARCLQSLQGVADEIIVMDSGSTDQTIAICRSYAARVYEQEWLGYGAQKNKANTFAQYPYILSLDADEALSDALRQRILEIKESPSADAYSMNRMTNYCGQWIKHCGWYPDKKIRLWKKGIGTWSLEKVHENLLIDSTVNVQHLFGNILHYTTYNISEHIAVVNKYTSYITEEYYAKKKKAMFLKILFAPLWSFIRDYIFKLGFLDGYYGFIVCKISAFATFLKYVKLRQRYQEQKVNKLNYT